MDPESFATRVDALVQRDRHEVLAHLRSYSVKVALPGEEFTLASGGKSRLYVDAKKTTLHCKMHHPIARLLRTEIGYFGGVDVLAGVVLGGAHLASVAASHVTIGDESMFGVALVRRREKDYGTRHRVERPWSPRFGETCVVVEDVVSTGATAVGAVDALREELFQVSGVVALIDRRIAADRSDTIAGVPFRSVFHAEDLNLPSEIVRLLDSRA